MMKSGLKKKKVKFFAIPGTVTQKTKMAATFWPKHSFLAISMRNIDLARKCLSTKWKSMKNATFLLLHKPLAPKLWKI